jgi:aldehyde:ferredoxin oxidoreductase
VNEGPYSGTVVEGPDYETIFALGSLCGNGNLESIARANELCDRLGIDTISAGNAIAFAMDCYERGIITKEDTEGIELRFGNHEAVVKFVEKIAMRSGLGDILAEGVRIAAQRFGKGAEKRAVHIKGLENPAFDPRGLVGTALGFAVADRGACHMWASVPEWRPGLDGKVYEGKAKLVKESSEFMAVVASMIFCRFARPFYPWKTLERISPMLMGVKISEADFKMIGERITTLARAFNVREGISRKDDMLPERFFEEPLPEGPSKGMVVNKEKFMAMLDEYYDLMGWDRNGIPTKAKLIELGLADVADEIESFRRKLSEVSRA